MQGQRETSSDAQSTAGSNKARKTQYGQTATTSSRIRRAARACDSCRGSKLRCEAADSSDDDKRCAHCAKMDLECTFDNPLPSHVVEKTRDDKDGRLSKLENNVARLLEMMEHKTTIERGIEGVNDRPTLTTDVYSAMPHSAPLPSQDQSSLAALAHFADQQPTSNFDNMDDWMGPSQLDMTLFNNAPTVPTHTFPGPTLPAQSNTWPPTAVPRWNDPPPPTSGSPLAVADTPLSHHSNKSSANERYGSAQARPIPKYGTASRMAAFTDPLSHEAPFRSLTYNPDTYRNAELVGEGSDEANLVVPTNGDGGKTPKRGIRDPIDNGIMGEEEAKALFSFFRDEISFFLPIFHEPMTFDIVRHRSSFLLSAILAVACKYCCVTTIKRTNDPFGTEQSVHHARHGVHPMEEDKWLQIRSWAMSSYFQALISKVHCLEDVQATLVLCAWGLQDRGASPDPWLMSGSAYRLARRLGIHHAAATLASGVRPSAKLIASLKTYLCLYAFDRFLTVGFGRPETEGFEPSTIDCSPFMRYLQTGSTDLEMFCTPESAASVTAYVDLANIARDYSRFVNVTLKVEPMRCTREMSDIGARLDAFSSRWLWARSPLASKLGLSARPVRMLYDHIRLCLHSVPLKAISHPESQSFLLKTGLQGLTGASILQKSLKKAEDSATGIIQAFADDSRDDSDSVFCYAYDYAYMVLSHSAATLLKLATIQISGVDTSNLAETAGRSRSGGMDRLTAMRYCGMAITSLVESNRSANFFPCDMAGNLSLIAKETGMSVEEWTSPSVVKATEARAAPPDMGPSMFSNIDNGLPMSDSNLFTEMDMFLQPGFFDDNSLFSGIF